MEDCGCTAAVSTRGCNGEVNEKKSESRRDEFRENCDRTLLDPGKNVLLLDFLMICMHYLWERGGAWKLYIVLFSSEVE